MASDLYVNKFSQPRPGSRIFLWTRQVTNGRKDARQRTLAHVPPREKPAQRSSNTPPPRQCPRSS